MGVKGTNERSGRESLASRATTGEIRLCRLALLLATVLALTLAFAPRADAPPPDPGSIDTIGRANLDGTLVEESFITGADRACGVAVDAAHVYWLTGRGEVDGGSRIGRANFDGTGANRSFITGFDFGCGVAVDGAYIYWPAQFGNTIARANLDGTGVHESFITQGGDCVAVDDAHIYWPTSGGIARANLDGTGVDESFITGLPNPPGSYRCGVAVDGSHVHWTNGATFTPDGRLVPGTIGRANLDGTGADDSFITDAGNPCGVAVDADHVYWASPSPSPADSRLHGSIGRANVNGTDADQNFIPLGARAFGCGVAVDASHVYWAHRVALPNNEFVFGKVKRNRKRGTAKLTVELYDGPGELKLAKNKKVKGKQKGAEAAGKEKLPIKPKGNAKKKLDRSGTAKVKAKVTYTPEGGEPNTQSKRLRLVKRR